MTTRALVLHYPGMGLEEEARQRLEAERRDREEQQRKLSAEDLPILGELVDMLRRYEVPTIGLYELAETSRRKHTRAEKKRIRDTFWRGDTWAKILREGHRVETYAVTERGWILADNDEGTLRPQVALGRSGAAWEISFTSTSSSGNDIRGVDPADLFASSTRLRTRDQFAVVTSHVPASKASLLARYIRAAAATVVAGEANALVIAII